MPKDCDGNELKVGDVVMVPGVIASIYGESAIVVLSEHDLDYHSMSPSRVIKANTEQAARFGGRGEEEK